MIALILAEAGGSVSGQVVVGIIGAIFTGLGVLYGKMVEKKAQTNEVTLKDQPIGVLNHQPTVTWSDHINLLRRVDKHDTEIADIRKDQAEQFKDLLEAASNRENRIIDKIDSVARSIHDRIDKGMRQGGKL